MSPEIALERAYLAFFDMLTQFSLIQTDDHTICNFCLLAEKCVLRHNRAQDDEEREKEETGVLPESVLQGLEPRHHGRLQ